MATTGDSSTSLRSSLLSLPLQLLDAAHSIYRSNVAPYATPNTIVGIVLIVAATNLYLRFARSPGSAKDGPSNSKKKGPSESAVVKDIFATLRRGNKKKGAAGKQDHPSNRPFGSSYYYAHNSSSATGGYKDGLRMEDYVMNGPKLLSKGGKRVEEEPTDAAEGAVDDDGEERPDPGRSAHVHTDAGSKDIGGKKPVIPPGSVPISRYMWDDEATTSNSSGAAKIYIDTLPNRPSTEPPIRWENSSITKSDVTAQVYGDDGGGLLVVVRRPAARGIEPKAYHLHVPRMYGTAEGVKAIVKSKRLLLKLTKKRNRLNIWDKKNLRPWPQLTEKPVGSGSGADYIDEDMFKKDVDPASVGGMDFDEDLFQNK